MGISLDVSRAPILRVTFPEVFSVADIQAHFERIIPIAREAPFLTVIDASAVRLSQVTASHRQAAADNYKRFALVVPKHNFLGEAFVVTSPLARGLLTAVRWLAPPNWNNRTFSSVKDALAWAEEQTSNNAQGSAAKPASKG